jgi:hypothetical protein
LPDRPDDYWKGAVIWVMAGAKWTSWTAVVTGYESAARTLRFNINKQGSIARNMNPGHRHGGSFYLVGKRGELDAPYEWFRDPEQDRLYVMLPDGQTPDRAPVRVKRRMLGVDMKGLSHVSVEGISVRGCTVSMEGARNCMLRGGRMLYISHTRGGNTGYGLNEPTGIRVTGSGNTVRDCEIAFSVGDGVYLGGERNAVINCWIHHIDYSGSYGAPVKTGGHGHLISHNTVHDAGRDCMQPGGEAILIQYNNIFNMGRIAHDLGATYVCGRDGGGTEFRYNWCHDNLAAGTRMGIYLDNFTSNYFVHHNVCWNVRGDEIRLNKPSLYNVVVNNTMLGKTGNWGRWKTDWMYGCIYANNLLTGDIENHPQATITHNLERIPSEKLNVDTFRAPGVGTDRGIPVPGITDNAPDRKPDLGAYEKALPEWRAGHDFENPPEPVYALTDTPLRNRVRHGSFSWGQFRGTLGPWRQTHGKTSTIVNGPGGIVVSYTERDTIIGAGACLQGNGDDGIEQDVGELSTGYEYDLAAWVKADAGVPVELSARSAGEQDAHSTTVTGTGSWVQANVRFRVPAGGREFTVAVVKRGQGTAFVDDVGLVAVVPGLPLGEPGFAPVTVKEPAAAAPQRPRPEVAVSRVATPPRVDGVVGPDEYPQKALQIRETPGAKTVDSAPCVAHVAVHGTTLYVAVTIPVGSRVPLVDAPVWTQAEGAEVCLRPEGAGDAGTGPVFVLHGYPNGLCESVTEAGVSTEAALALRAASTYAARVSDRMWCAEWAIPLSAVGAERPAGVRLGFNIGIRRQAAGEWLAWRGTGAQNWRVERAGVLVLP